MEYKSEEIPLPSEVCPFQTHLIQERLKIDEYLLSEEQLWQTFQTMSEIAAPNLQIVMNSESILEKLDTNNQN